MSKQEEITGICSNCYSEVNIHTMKECPKCKISLHQRWPFSEEETKEMLCQLEKR